MFQIGAVGGLDNDNSTPNWFLQAIRGILSLFDMAVYSLVTVVYEILFNIADSTIFSSNTIKNFYSRIQLIIGVFMIFKLSISLLHAVINPDYLTDQKKGMGKIITRLIAMLAMFAAIIPLSIPLSSSEIQAAKDGKIKSYNYHLNQSGLLFGTMYSLQERILKGNVLVKLVLGDNGNKYDVSKNSKGLENQAQDLAIFVLKGFVRINIDESAVGKGKITEDDYICSKTHGRDYSSSEQKQLNNYINANDIMDVINPDNITEYCNDGPGADLLTASNHNTDNRWMFTYTPIISTICGALLLVVLVSYCIDIAIRALKLAILRLLAPIPIISYVDPKSSENGSFAAWMKALISTYVDLFIRLAIIYFIVFLVQDICENGLDIPITNGIVGVLSSIFIIIGLFFFARSAPKFIRDALGLKGMMSNVGLSGLLGAAGAFVGGSGLAGAGAGALDAMNNSAEAAAQGKQAPSGWSTGRNLAAQIRTGDEKAQGGILNRAKDNLKRDASIRQASRYGVTHGELDRAKARMYDEENKLARMQGDVQRLQNGEMSAGEQDDILNNDNYQVTGTDAAGNTIYTKTKRDAAGNVISTENFTGKDAAIRDALYSRIEAQKKTHGAAKTNYERALEFGQKHHVETTFEEEHRRGFFAKRNNLDTKTDHQGMADRILGREQADGVRRRDNTWSADDPNKFG